MAEYICREDVIRKITEVQDRATSGMEDVTYYRAKKIIREMPSAEVQPVVHAYWIRGKEFGFKTHNPMWYCSNCGGGIRYDTTLRTYQKQKKPVQEVNCFCRKCGAKMDLEPIYDRGGN